MIVWCKRCDAPIEYRYGSLKWPHYKSTEDRPMCGSCSLQQLNVRAEEQR